MNRLRAGRTDRGRQYSSADRAHAGRVDCEHVRPGLIGQPVNTVTSVAYLGIAAWLVNGQPRRRRWLWAGLSAGVVVHQGTQTGRPGFRPDSPWQGHGLWHVVSALAVARWIAATEPVLGDHEDVDDGGIRDGGYPSADGS